MRSAINGREIRVHRPEPQRPAGPHRPDAARRQPTIQPVTVGGRTWTSVMTISGARRLPHAAAAGRRAELVRRPRRASQVDHVPGEAVDGLLQTLGQRGVGVDVAGHLVGREVPLLRQRQLGQQLGGLRADDVAAEQLAVGVVADQLDEPAGLADALRLAVGRERELRDLDLPAALPSASSLACASRVAEARDLRRGRTSRAASSRTPRHRAASSRRRRSSRPRPRPGPRRRGPASASR